MLGQIAPFNPYTSMGLFEMRKLLKKNVAFTVTEVMRKEFEEAKNLKRQRRISAANTRDFTLLTQP